METYVFVKSANQEGEEVYGRAKLQPPSKPRLELIPVISTPKKRIEELDGSLESVS